MWRCSYDYVITTEDILYPLSCWHMPTCPLRSVSWRWPHNTVLDSLRDTSSDYIVGAPPKVVGTRDCPAISVVLVLLYTMEDTVLPNNFKKFTTFPLNKWITRISIAKTIWRFFLEFRNVFLLPITPVEFKIQSRTASSNN